MAEVLQIMGGIRMAFMDKFKDAAKAATEKASSVKSSAMDGISKMKEANEQKKAEKKALMAQLKSECNQWKKELENRILEAYDNSTGMFDNLETGVIDKFTKEYYEMMVLPGSRQNITCLTMKPNITEKALKAMVKNFVIYDGVEVPLVHVKENNGLELILTQTYLFFRFKYQGNKDVWCESKIPVAKINSLAVNIGEGIGEILINGVKLEEVKLTGCYKQDFISFNHYFERMFKRDFVIDEEQIDRNIQEKLGESIYNQVKKYFVDEEEKLLFYAGGLDSLTAVDYVACTDQQVIVVNREMLGATADVKQFYFEDVTSMATIQNTQSNDLFVAMIDTALTSALKVCNLEITVAGSKQNINTLYLVEATRIIAIYHEARKKAKQAKQQPVQTVVTQVQEPDILGQIEKLSKLKDTGILSEEEFVAKKTELLSKL